MVRRAPLGGVQLAATSAATLLIVQTHQSENREWKTFSPLYPFISMKIEDIVKSALPHVPPLILCVFN